MTLKLADAIFIIIHLFNKILNELHHFFEEYGYWADPSFFILDFLTSEVFRISCAAFSS